MATTAGDPKALYQHLREARIAGEGRSPLADDFDRLEAVDVAAHEQYEPSPASFIKEDTAPIAYWPQVQIRYSRLVEPVAPGELVDFVRRLRSLSGHPSFVRLNRTKQLGTTSLAGNIGASHSRLEHSYLFTGRTSWAK